jgi:hypothetical protein
MQRRKGGQGGGGVDDRSTHPGVRRSPWAGREAAHKGSKQQQEGSRAKERARGGRRAGRRSGRRAFEAASLLPPFSSSSSSSSISGAAAAARFLAAAPTRRLDAPDGDDAVAAVRRCAESRPTVGNARAWRAAAAGAAAPAPNALRRIIFMIAPRIVGSPRAGW